jgi:hypothetical protein
MARPAMNAARIHNPQDFGNVIDTVRLEFIGPMERLLWA